MAGNNAIKAVLSGAAGKMGKRLICLICESQDIVLHGAIEKSGHPSLGADAGETAGAGRIGAPITDDAARALKGADVLIEFSSPEASLEHLKSAAITGAAAVIGTTGFSPDQRANIEDLSKSIRCVMSPNFSVGVNIMYELIARAAPLLGPDYDIEIFEAHHRFKKDAPSGTALRMAEVLAKSLKKDPGEVCVYSRKGIIGERKSSEIGLQAIRAGDIVGEHTVIFGGLGERLEITHRAHSRDNFARGALRAARWVLHKKPGLYDMINVLGLR